MNIPSIYKEIGLNGRFVMHGESHIIKRVKPYPDVRSTDKVVHWGHNWDSARNKELSRCRYCRLPKFIADGRKCRRRK